jgi:hypothetical protein
MNLNYFFYWRIKDGYSVLILMLNEATKQACSAADEEKLELESDLKTICDILKLNPEEMKAGYKEYNIYEKKIQDISTKDPMIKLLLKAADDLRKEAERPKEIRDLARALEVSHDIIQNAKDKKKNIALATSFKQGKTLGLIVAAVGIGLIIGGISLGLVSLGALSPLSLGFIKLGVSIFTKGLAAVTIGAGVFAVKHGYQTTQKINAFNTYKERFRNALYPITNNDKKLIEGP